MVSASGTNGTSVAATRPTKASFVIGASRIVFTTSKAIAQIGKGLDVAAAHQWLTGGRAAAEPFRVELAHVSLGERAVLAEARPLRGGELRRQHQERTEYQTQHKRDHDDDLDLEVWQSGAEVEDPAGNEAGKQSRRVPRQGGRTRRTRWQETPGRRHGPGCVGTRLNSMRDTCQRKRAQMKIR